MSSHLTNQNHQSDTTVKERLGSMHENDELCRVAPSTICRYGADHDLLIKIQTLQEVMITEVKDLKANFVTKDEFAPIKRLVYGLTSAIGLAIVAALMRLLFTHNV